MKSSPNKSTVSMSDDILNQNHHLKGEIIKMRKSLRNYEDTMVNQFDKIADDLGLEKPGFIFQTPDECLNYFIQVINRNVSKNRVLTKQMEDLTKQLSNVKQKSETYLKAYQVVKIKQKEKDDTILLLQNTNKNILIDLQEQKKQTELANKNWQQDINNLQQQNAKKEAEYKIKFLSQKKELVEKTNKQMGQYRFEVDQEMTKREKALKTEIEKKERQLKSVMQSINSLVQKNQKQEVVTKPKGKQRTKSQWKLPPQKVEASNSNTNPIIQPILSPQNIENSLNLQSQQQIQNLRTVIKPFLDHGQLLQKISELRKQNIQLKSDIRKNNTTITTLQSNVNDKNNQISLHISKIQTLQLEFQKTQNQLTQKQTRLQKYRAEEEQLDKYYDQRWNSQISRVKSNLQKKFTQKNTKLETLYTERKKAIEVQLSRIGKQIAHQRKQANRLRKQNETYVSQKQFIEIQRQNSNLLIDDLRTRLFQNHKMHSQQILTIRVQHDQKYKSMLVKLKNYKNQISKLQNQLDQLNLVQARVVCQLKQQFNQKIKQKVEETKEYYQEIIGQDYQRINKLSFQIQSNKIAFQELKREKQIKIQQVKQKTAREKDKEIREIKVKTFEEVTKFKQKLTLSESSLTDLKQFVIQKQQTTEKEKQDHQGLINKKQSAIKWLQAELKNKEKQQKNLQKMYGDLFERNRQLQFREQSQIVENKSLKFIIASKQEQISSLQADKRRWVLDIEQSKKQFYHGFHEINETNQKVISYYKSRICQLQKIHEGGGISQKDYDKIKNLSDEKKKLQNEVALKQTQNLVLNQIKQFYQRKSKDLGNKIMTEFQLRNQKETLFSRKYKKKTSDMNKSKSYMKEELTGLSGMDSYEIKQLNEDFKFKNKSAQKIQKAQDKFKKFQIRARHRLNSSMV